jgi:site-specific recombinase XerD
MSLRFRPDRKKWELSIKDGGKRKRLLFDTKREAADHLAPPVTDSKPVCLETQSSITLESAIASYFSARSSTKSRCSKAGERRTFNLKYHFLVSEKGLTYLDQVRYSHLVELQNWLGQPRVYKGKQMHWSPSTVNRAFNSIKDFYVYWVRNETLKSSPAVHVKSLSAPENARRPMTDEEYVRVHRASDDWFRPVVTFMYMSASASSSVARFRWEDVNFEAKEVTITRRKGKSAPWRRKTYPMLDDMAKLLADYRLSYPLAKQRDVVFRNEHGKALTAEWCSRVGMRAVRAAGLSGVYFYGLRHALASDLTDANVSMEVIRQLMGHSNIRTTQRYAQPKSDTMIAALRLVRGQEMPPEMPPEIEDVACGGKSV